MSKHPPSVRVHVFFEGVEQQIDLGTISQPVRFDDLEETLVNRGIPKPFILFTQTTQRQGYLRAVEFNDVTGEMSINLDQPMNSSHLHFRLCSVIPMHTKSYKPSILGTTSMQATATRQRWRSRHSLWVLRHVSQPNCSASTSIPQGELNSPCYDGYFGDDVNAGNGPSQEIVFMTLAIGFPTA